MKKIAIATSLLIIFALLLTGCGASSLMSFGIFEDADKYSVGDAVPSAEKIRKLDVEWVSGSIEIISGGDSVSASEGAGLVSEKSMRWRVDDGVLYVKFCASGYSGTFSRDEIAKKSLKVYIPADVDIKVDSVSADVSIKADGAGVGVGGEISLETVSANITLDGVVGGNVKATSVSGNIGVSRAKIKAAIFESTSGKVAFSGDAASLKIGTLSGDVSVDLEKTSATVEFITISGKLRTSLDYTKSDGKFIFGNGESLVKVNTSSGNLTVK